MTEKYSETGVIPSSHQQLQSMVITLVNIVDGHQAAISPMV